MKHLILTALLASTFSLSALAQGGGGGAGVRGGGNVIEANGKLELLDLVTTATCDWYSGKELMEANSGVSQILKKVEKLDWYLALELEREIQYLSWCMTGKLYSVPAADEDSFVQQLTKGIQQAAFRYNESAYIDQKIFNSLSPSSRAYLILHETLHSYLPMNTEMRRFKLMGLVTTLNKVGLGQINTRESLHLNLNKNDMKFPLTVKKLEPFKKTIQFILGSKEKRIEAFLAVNSPESLINKNVTAAELNVASWDKEIVRNPEAVLIQTVKDIFMSEDLAAIKTMLRVQQFKKINPASIGIALFDELNAETQNEILNSPYLNNISNDVIDFLGSIDIEISHNRLLSDLALQSLSEQCQERSPLYLTSLTASKECGLPETVEGLAAFMVLMIKSNNTQVLENSVYQNQELLMALKLENLKTKLSSLATPIAREKALGLRIISDLQKNLISSFAEYIKVRVSTEEFNSVEKFINKL